VRSKRAAAGRLSLATQCNYHRSMPIPISNNNEVKERPKDLTVARKIVQAAIRALFKRDIRFFAVHRRSTCAS